MATAALVCGIVGLVGFFFAVPSVVAVVLGFVAADRARRHPGPGDGRGRATAGWILGLIGLAAFVVFIVATAATGGFDDEDVSVFSLDVGDCVDISESDEVEVLPLPSVRRAPRCRGVPRRRDDRGGCRLPGS